MQYKVTCWIFSFCKWIASPLLSNLEAVEKYKQRSLNYHFYCWQNYLHGDGLELQHWILRALLARSALREQTLNSLTSRSICGPACTCTKYRCHILLDRARMEKVLQPCLCKAAWALIQVLLHGRRNRGEYHLSSMFAEKMVNQGLSLRSSGLISISHIR